MAENKKRKRSGKQREERKKAILLEAEAAGGDAQVEAVKDERPEDESIVPYVPSVDTEAHEPIEEKKAEPVVDHNAIAKRIAPALKKLHPVFKQAKKGETMRLIKKIRFLKSKDSPAADITELEAQLKLLSAIQLNALAATHLKLKVKKHHTFKRSGLPDTVSAAFPDAPSVAASSSSATPAVIAKVENRLCSEKHVAEAVKPVLAWVMMEPGATLSIAKRAPAGKPKAKAASESESEDSESDDEMAPKPLLALDSDDEAVVEDKAADEAGWESGDLGGDGEDGAGWESGSVGGSDSGSDSDSDASAVVRPPPKKAKPAPEPKSKKKKDDGTSSMFLPSLATGFTPGDGDSDPDMDYDEDGVIGNKTVARKNRRGQRARQAIWEKKYGKGAKHVVKAKEAEKAAAKAKAEKQAQRFPRGPRWEQPAGQDGGWGSKLAIGEAAQDMPAPAAASAAAAPAAAPRTARPAAPAPAAAKGPDGNALHPSWEAARLRRQREMGGATGDAPKATKIVFD